MRAGVEKLDNGAPESGGVESTQQIVISFHLNPGDNKKPVAYQRRESSPRTQLIFLRVFCGIFAAVGWVLFYVLCLRNLPAAIQSRSWPATPCSVLSAKVTSVKDTHDSGLTYGVAVRYQYAFGGQLYISNRYGFVNITDGDLAEKQRLVKQLKSSSPQTCFVNPADPTVAVMDRSLGGVVGAGFFTLLFALLGSAGLYYSRRVAYWGATNTPASAV
jgi:hypothetical protein